MSLQNHYRLASSDLAVEVVPGEGGRIASIKSLRSGLEFLTQTARRSSDFAPSLSASFRDGPCAGIEECLPTVGPSGPKTNGGAAPDHGDFWQLAWTVLRADDTKLTQAALGFSRPLRFEKTVEVIVNRLDISYSVQNTGVRPESFLYACHPLFAVASGDQIVLPTEIDALQLDYSRANRIGQVGDRVSWPVTQQGIRLDRAGTESDGTAEMLYSKKLKDGKCGIFRSESQEFLDLSFDVQRLPYLGVWLCYGGWPDDAQGNPQYAVALEPTTSPNNTLELAQKDGTALILQPEESYVFQISLAVTLIQ